MQHMLYKLRSALSVYYIRSVYFFDNSSTFYYLTLNLYLICNSLYIICIIQILFSSSNDYFNDIIIKYFYPGDDYNSNHQKQTDSLDLLFTYLHP